MTEFTGSKSFKSDSSSVKIDKPGTYNLNVNFKRKSQYSGFSTIKTILPNSPSVDTIRLPKLLFMLCALHKPITCFSFCDTIANGYYEDHYSNGNLRLKGSFINGCPQGVIEYYNIEGKIVKKEFYKDCIIIDSRVFKNNIKIESY